MWSVHVVTHLLFCYACLSTGNDRVRFVSKNFYNVLHWDHVEPRFPGQKVLYSVQYWRDDEKQYWIKDECQNISHLSCDLTAETPSVYDVHYRAKVMVNGSCLDVTTFFVPFRDTVLGPPLLSLHTTASTLQVNVTLPQGPNGVSIADIIASSKKGSLKVVPEYTLKITHPQWAAQVIKSTTGHFDINLKYNQSEYCGEVVYIPTPEWGRSVSENASFCVTLPDDPRIPLLWPLLGVAVLAAIVIISAVCTCNYVKGEKHSSMTHVLVIPPCRVTVHQDPIPEVFEEVIGIHRCPDKHPNVSEGDGCFPQASPICQDNPDTSTQSSESYGAVATPTHDEGNKGASGRGNRQPTNPTLPCREKGDNDKGGISPQFTSYRAQQLPIVTTGERNPEEEPLVPTTVTPPQKCKVMEHQDKNLRVSEVVVGIHSDQSQSKNQMSEETLNVSKGGGYFPQASPVCQYNPDTSTQSSESYGVVAAQTHIEGNKGASHQFGRGNSQPTNNTVPCSEKVNNDKGGISPQFTSYHAPQLPIVMAGESNPEEEPLVLTTVTPPQKCKVMEHQDKNLRVSEVVVGIHSDQSQSKNQMSEEILHFSERGGYFPQASPVCQYNPDTSTQSSESYGVVAAQTHIEGNKGASHQFGRGNRQPTNNTLPCSEKVNNDKGRISPQFTSYHAPQLPIVMAGESNPEEEPLVLTTVRNIDGQLVLWPFTFGLQSRSGNLESHLDTERKPLLLDDIICQDGPLSKSLERLDSLDGRDSGFFGSTVNTPTGSCFNSNYSNSETMVPGFQQQFQTMLPGDTVFQSGYKKNWMPENPPGPIDIH
ncbi:interferon lambda receptor 1 [Fundulus heteroclitus]|uniref:interferon lambda receptor 1 n=1 Tax=Fundulus heteroclitus TaxID=8078 RepID=UPI00165C8DA4|nr:interferon lambda receptor 1 [Fundulus heteroclitus]